jgi:hypothetical protein
MAKSIFVAVTSLKGRRDWRGGAVRPSVDQYGRRLSLPRLPVKDERVSMANGNQLQVKRCLGRRRRLCNADALLSFSMFRHGRAHVPRHRRGSARSAII